MKDKSYAFKSEPGAAAFHQCRMMGHPGILANAEMIDYAIKNNMIAG